MGNRNPRYGASGTNRFIELMPVGYCVLVLTFSASLSPDIFSSKFVVLELFEQLQQQWFVGSLRRAGMYCVSVPFRWRTKMMSVRLWSATQASAGDTSVSSSTNDTSISNSSTQQACTEKGDRGEHTTGAQTNMRRREGRMLSRRVAG